jgi:GntR family transcriptional regulator
MCHAALNKRLIRHRVTIGVAPPRLWRESRAKRRRLPRPPDFGQVQRPMRQRKTVHRIDDLPRRLTQGGGMPLYKQVYEALRMAIVRGPWPADTPLPTEGELCARFAVSKITVRHALQLLESAGHIRKHRARNAVVASGDHAAGYARQIDSVNDLIAAAGGSTLRVLSYRQEAAPDAAALFDLPADTRLHCLRSLLMRGRKAFARSIIYFHPSIGSRLKRGDFDDPVVFRVMQRELDVRLADVRLTIRADLAAPEDQRQLGCARGEAVLVTQLVYRSDRERIVEIALTRFPASSASITYRLDAHGGRLDARP